MDIRLPTSGRIQLPGHFDTPVILEQAETLPKGYDCRVRLSDGSLEEADA